MAVSSINDLKKYADGVEVELPGWEVDVPFIAKLRRPSLLLLAAEGQIPNALLGTAAKLFNEGASKANFNETAEVFQIMAKASLASPTYDELQKAGLTLTDSQLLQIYTYSQTGVDALRRFREQREATERTPDVKAVSKETE